MNPNLSGLQPYPFERLAKLLEGSLPNPEHTLLRLSIGEPQHAPPPLVVNALSEHLPLLAKYPATKGDGELRESLANWLSNRYQLPNIDAQTQVLPVNGTREALFAIAQAVVTPSADALVGAPNPFYQIYEGAALLAGARTALLDTREEHGFLPNADDFDEKQWRRLQLLYLCSPGNPSGSVMQTADFVPFIEKALKHDVVLVSDECYSEIYPDEKSPPTGLLATCKSMGLDDYRNCVSMHSLSKRSNLPGLRSGFAAGDARILAEFLRYRGYHGSAMPPHHQVASTAAWSDESHVIENRGLYREKFAAVTEILSPHLGLNQPQGGFYLWPKTPVDDETFTRRLYEEQAVLVLPGSYLGRASEKCPNRSNPGAGRVRMALVDELENCIEAARRIAALCQSIGLEGAPC